MLPRPRGEYVYSLHTCPARFRGVVGRFRFVPAPAVLLHATDERTDIFSYLFRGLRVEIITHKEVSFLHGKTDETGT